jgi:anionic cell wall polymer biosynthesis LytR-Cps2A-Psr (LCP) family protein
MSKFQTKRITKAEPHTEIVKEEEKKTSKWFSRKIVISTVLLVFTGVFFSVVWAKLSETHEKNGSDKYIPTPPSVIEEFLSEKVAGTTNILIAGIGGKGHDGSDLTDSIMLASLNGETKKVTLLSIPRDLYVSYGERG